MHSDEKKSLQGTILVPLNCVVWGCIIRIKSGEQGFLGFSVPEWLGGVICKPEGSA